MTDRTYLIEALYTTDAEGIDVLAQAVTEAQVHGEVTRSGQYRTGGIVAVRLHIRLSDDQSARLAARGLRKAVAGAPADITRIRTGAGRNGRNVPFL